MELAYAAVSPGVVPWALCFARALVAATEHGDQHCDGLKAHDAPRFIAPDATSAMAAKVGITTGAASRP
jgi:hypothetical protein